MNFFLYILIKVTYNKVGKRRSRCRKNETLLAVERLPILLDPAKQSFIFDFTLKPPPARIHAFRCSAVLCAKCYAIQRPNNKSTWSIFNQFSRIFFIAKNAFYITVYINTEMKTQRKLEYNFTINREREKKHATHQ